MKRAEAFPSQYMSKDDVMSGPVRLTIADVRKETVSGETGADDKPVMVFLEPDSKKMVVNSVNWDTIADAFGEDTVDWIGKKIDLYLDPGVMYGGRRVGGVRIRMPAGTAARSSTSDNDVMTYAQAITACADVGISKEQLIESLKKSGLAGYNPRRDTSKVHALIAAVGQVETAIAESDIPF